jgi:hypothetical protein
MISLPNILEILIHKGLNMKDRGVIKKYWVTSDGRKIKIKNLGNTHLKNIVNKMLKKNIDIPPIIREEYLKRGFGIIKPLVTNEELLNRLEMLEQKVALLEKFGEL